MRKIVLFFSVVISAAFCFTCSLTSAPKSWTIMVWLDADNDLELNGVIDFNEIEYGLFLAQSGDPEIMQKLNIVVQMDRAPGYDNKSHDSGRDWTDTRRYYVIPDSNDDSSGPFVSLKIADLGEVNMGDAFALKDFIDFCKSGFPADNYMLVLWNHGGGVKSMGSGSSSASSGMKWVAIDDTNSDLLYTAEITDTLTDAESVRIIGFDACLMGLAEIGYEYRPGVPGKFGADYMVASAPTEGGDGWEYYKILERLGNVGYDKEGDPFANTSSLAPADLASIVVKEYADALLNHDSTDSAKDQVMSAYDLSKITNVKTELDSLAIELKGSQVAVVNNIQGSVSSPIAMKYFIIDEDYWIYAPNFDLYDFALKINTDNSDFPASTVSSQRLMNAVDDCVISSWARPIDYTGFNAGRNGLAFFFPGDGTVFGTSNKFYWYEWWYTAEDTNVWGPAHSPSPYIYPGYYSQGYNYGKLDFCASETIAKGTNGEVDNWHELLKSWYDPANLYTPGTW